MMMETPLCCLFILSTLVPAVLRAEPAGPKSRAEVLGIAHLPKVQVELKIYRVKGESVDTFKPLDLPALDALVAETRARREPPVKREVGGGIIALEVPDTDGARVITNPMVLIVASKSKGGRVCTMDATQELYADSQGLVSDPEAYTGEEELRKIVSGVQATMQVWQDAPTGKLVAEVQATVSGFEGFVEVQVAESDGSTTPVKVPVLESLPCGGVVTLTDGEPGILCWRERFTESGKSLIVATVTATTKGTVGERQRARTQ
ncbi:MAG: hypothetical protein Q7Q73_15265 [Verrucomicrobiota bacterium JB024]|nr:hypothetical protein [Verrucomicrobiota bacterium JB024]